MLSNNVEEQSIINLPHFQWIDCTPRNCLPILSIDFSPSFHLLFYFILIISIKLTVNPGDDTLALLSICSVRALEVEASSAHPTRLVLPAPSVEDRVLSVEARVPSVEARVPSVEDRADTDTRLAFSIAFRAEFMMARVDMDVRLKERGFNCF